MANSLCTSAKDSSGPDKPHVSEPQEDYHDHAHDLPTAEEKEKMLEPEMVDMWNPDAAAGPEWGGPYGYEPTKHGDWARNGRVTDF